MKKLICKIFGHTKGRERSNHFIAASGGISYTCKCRVCSTTLFVTNLSTRPGQPNPLPYYYHIEI